MMKAISTKQAEFSARARSQARRRAMGVIAIGLPCGIALGLILAVPAATLGGPRGVALALTCALGAILLAAIIWLTRPPRGADADKALIGQTDELQRKRSVGLMLFAFFVFLLTDKVWRETGQLLREPNAIGFALLGSMLVVSLTHLATVMGLGVGRKLDAIYNDELSRHLRSRALLVGFCALFAGIMGVFALGLVDPFLAVQAIPLLVLYGIVAISVSYAVMDLRADRGE